MCADIKPCLNELHTNSKLLVIVQSNYVRFAPTIDRSKIFCSTNNLYTFHISIRSRLGSHLISVFDNFILRLVEAGIPTNWRILQIYENQWINIDSSKMTGLKINEKVTFDRENKDNITALNIKHIGGAIIIFIIGNSLATIVFIIELLVKAYYALKVSYHL